MSVFTGILFHGIGGGAAATFYLPFKKVKNWAWESYWLISGIAAWLVMPLVMGWLFIPELFEAITSSPRYSLWWTFFFGLLWGIGGLTFGLSLRYLGISLGYAVVLGFSAAFGTIIPPIFDGTIVEIIRSQSGIFILLGILICLTGIGMCAIAGKKKDKELSDHEKKTSITEFNLRKGTIIAFASGILSACMAFAFAAGKPIAEEALANGALVLWQNNAVLVVILWGGFLSNLIWCCFLNIRNKTYKNYTSGTTAQLTNNYFYSSLAGATWYLQFFFYGMGSTQMGQYDFVSWTLHMTFIIVFSTLWGLFLQEWKGTGRQTKQWLWSGLALLILSIIIIGIGGSLG